MSAEFDRESEFEGFRGLGEQETAEQADARTEIDGPSGLLGRLCATWFQVQQLRKSMAQRGLEELATEQERVENRLSRRVSAELRRHPLWPWLSQFPGLGGVHTARLLVRIDDPWKFPGQRCTRGHYTRPIYAVGQVCPVTVAEVGPGIANGSGHCDGTMLDPRPGTGTRSLWHFAGLHVVNGRSPRKTRGQRCDWDPVARTCVLQPGGIAEQIVRQRVPRYRDIYDQAKERLTNERGADAMSVIERIGGAVDDGVGAGIVRAVDGGPGLRPIQIENLARKIAAKAFVGDLLAEWKRVDSQPAIEHDPGALPPAPGATAS